MFGESVLALDVPPLVDGIDQGSVPTPMQQSAQLAAEAWGAHRTWLLTNGASKGNLVTCLALRHVGELIVAQRSMHSSVMDGMVLGGLQCHFVQPVIDVELGAAHGITPESWPRHWTRFPAHRAVYVVSPSYFGARIGPSGAGRCRPLESLRPESWTAPGDHTSVSTPTYHRTHWRRVPT